MRKAIIIAIVSLLSCLILSGGKASAQTMTTFSKCIISFDSNSPGVEVIYNGEVIGKTPFKKEVKADYLISCDNEDAPMMSPSDIKGYNSIRIENYIKESGKKSGTFPFFGMTFIFRDASGKENTITIPLKWENVNLFGMNGSRIFYQDSVMCEF